ncbi:hypothetical protein D3C73_1319540 [compost metagenome]
MLLGKFHHFAVLQIWRQLDLVRGDLIATHGINRLLHQIQSEVGDPNLAGQAQFFGFRQLSHKLGHRDFVIRRRPVDQSQVNIAGLQFSQALPQAWDQLALRQIGDPDFGGDKQLVTWHTAGSNRLAHRSFIFVDLCSINGAIPQLQRRADRVDDDLILKTEGT